MATDKQEDKATNDEHAPDVFPMWGKNESYRADRSAYEYLASTMLIEENLQNGNTAKLKQSVESNELLKESINHLKNGEWKNFTMNFGAWMKWSFECPEGCESLDEDKHEKPTAQDREDYPDMPFLRVSTFGFNDTVVQRYPRFLNPHDTLFPHGVLELPGRGMCGEYAKVCQYILRSYGIKSRIVLDFTDHVFCEIFVNGRWIHVDTCGHFNDTLLYERDWGKKIKLHLAYDGVSVTDVTERYTTNLTAAIERRKDLTFSKTANDTIQLLNDAIHAKIQPKEIYDRLFSLMHE